MRQTAEGYFVLHAIRSDSGEHRSYRVDRMQGATVTSQVFTPRYAVELTFDGAAHRCSFDGDAPNSKHAPRGEHQAPGADLRLPVHRLPKDI